MCVEMHVGWDSFLLRIELELANLIFIWKGAWPASSDPESATMVF